MKHENPPRFSRQSKPSFIKPEKPDPPDNLIIDSESWVPEQSDLSDNPIPFTPPDKNIFISFNFETARRRVEAIIKEAEEEGKSAESSLIQSRIGQTIRDTWTEIKEATNSFKIQLSQLLHGFGKPFSKMTWITNDGKIMRNLNKRRNRFLLNPIMDHYKATQLLFVQTRTYGRMKIEGKMRFPILALPDIEGVAELIDQTKSQVIKYITGTERNGIMMRFGPKHHGSFLVLGYHNWHKDKKTGEFIWSPSYFVRNTPEGRKALREFRRPD